MDWETIENRLERSFERVVDHDSELLVHESCERAVAHRLAVYVEQEFPGLHVDCEYNKQGTEGKRKTIDVEGGSKMADPDIIVHRRGPEGPNLLALEVKPETAKDEDQEYDRTKLREYLRKHGYTFAALVVYRVGADDGYFRIERIE